ncbi:MAG: IspD/TarI family cytidylyltransferase [Oscillospiraceae bacterium]
MGMFVSVIIACGGTSSRMGGQNKLFVKLHGIPVIVRAMQAFDEIHEVREMILCAAESSIDALRGLIASYDFRKPVLITTGAQTRQKSIAKGFSLISPESELVCIHDGARPLIRTHTVCKCIADAKKHGAAVVCVPSKDTVKLAQNGFVAATPARENVMLTQTPQIFRTELYRNALIAADEAGADYTDDSQLCEAVGVMPFVTIGEYSNIKITTAEDIPVAESLLKSTARG